MKSRQVIEDRLEHIADMLDSTTGFLDQIDFFIPKLAKKMIYSMLKSEEINSFVQDIQRRRPPRMVFIGQSNVERSRLIHALFGSYLTETSVVESGAIDVEIIRYMKDEKLVFEALTIRNFTDVMLTDDDVLQTALDELVTSFKADAFLLFTHAVEQSTLKDEATALFALTRKMKQAPPIITVMTGVEEIEAAAIKTATAYSQAKIAQIEQKKRQVAKLVKCVGIKQSTVVPVSSYIEWEGNDPERLSIAVDGRYNIETLVEAFDKQLELHVMLDLMMNIQLEKTVEMVANTFVKRFSAVSGLVGASPIPVADVLVLLPLQVIEVSLIAYLSGNKIDGKTAREFITSLGAVFMLGFGLRFAAQQGSKLLNVIPGAGSAVSGTVAYTGTYSIGKAAIAYYIKGLSLDEAKQEALEAKKSISSKKAEEPTKSVKEKRWRMKKRSSTHEQTKKRPRFKTKRFQKKKK